MRVALHASLVLHLFYLRRVDQVTECVPVVHATVAVHGLSVPFAFLLETQLFHIVFMQGCTLGFSTIALMFICLFYYKNVSFIICKRLLYEPNVVMIIILTLFILTIDFLKPHDAYSYPIAIVYVDFQ